MHRVAKKDAFTAARLSSTMAVTISTVSLCRGVIKTSQCRRIKTPASGVHVVSTLARRRNKIGSSVLALQSGTECGHGLTACTVYKPTAVT